MYQKRILPHFFIPSTFSPQAPSPLERYRQMEKILHPLLPNFFFLLSAWGPTPGTTLMGWPNYGVYGHLNKMLRPKQGYRSPGTKNVCRKYQVRREQRNH